MFNEKKVKNTGISGLDKILTNGVPTGHVVLIQGEAGTGKTVLSMQWLFEGWNKFQENGIYIAVTESYNKTLKNINDMDFFDEEMVNEGNIRFTDLRSMTQIMGWEEKEIERSDVDELVEKVETLVEGSESERLVIDSITAVGYILDNKELLRYLIFRLSTMLDSLDCTLFLTSEGKDDKSTFSVEDFISDGIIQMEHVMGEQRMMRYINIIKMRGVNYRSGKVVFEIDSEGLNIFPKIPVGRKVAKTNFELRNSTGVSGLDEMIGGGYPEGHIILLTGNTGTGKSTFGMQFLMEGVRNDETGVFVNLEEPLTQVKKTAESHGWDFDRYEKDGLLNFISPDLIDTYPDKFLYEILDTIDETDAKRLMIDSVSSLPSAGMSEDQLRENLLQLNSALKKRGVTTAMTFLSSSMFSSSGETILGETSASDLRLSSLTDGIILLRYIEEKNSIGKIMNVLKMRGIAHSKEIKRFEIGEKGIQIGEKIKEVD